jgi:hypothetical protein
LTVLAAFGFKEVGAVLALCELNLQPAGAELFVLLLWVGFPAQSPRQQPTYGIAPGFETVLKSEVI